MRRLHRFTLRSKLLVGFFVMALMAGVCGVIGMIFVNRIAATVAVVSDTTSPLLAETTALIDSARRMRTIVLQAVSDGNNTGSLTEQVEHIDADTRSRLTRLRMLGTRAGAEHGLESAERQERDYVDLLKQMLLSHQRRHELHQAEHTLIARSENAGSDLDARLLEIAGHAEGRLFKIEDEAKVRVQTGRANPDELGDLISQIMADLYPIVQNARKLMRDNERIDDVVKRLGGQVDDDGIATIEREAVATFKAAAGSLQKLAGRLRSAEERARLATLRDGLAGREAALLGSDGLIASRRDMLALEAELSAGREMLDQIDQSYMALLGEVQQTVGRVNEQARQNAQNVIIQSGSTIAATVLATILAALVFGFLFADRISTPLRSLTDHAARIRESGELLPLPGSLLERRDEIGTLSRSLDLMITELADARRRLIAWSEQEISTQYERLSAAISNMPQGLCMFDADQKLVICNRRYAEIYALSPEHSAPGTPLLAILEDHIANGTCPDDVEGYVEKRITAVTRREPFYRVCEHRNGQVIAISFQPMSNGGSVATHEDITERRRAEARIAYMAHHDALTDLPNRASFREQMNQAIPRVERGEKMAVLCIDLDHFKTVNDTLGHPIGDALLKAVSARLLASLRSTDIVARLGGDEFAVVQVGGEQPRSCTAAAAAIIKALGEPFDVLGHQVVVGASVGIALAPEDGRNPDELMKNADMALYRAKEDGRGAFRFFEAAMDTRMQARRALELDLRKALALHEFFLVYQPIVSLATDDITTFEALLRWRHPERGIVPPNEFIPLAEEIGLIGPIMAWVLREACTEAAGWPGHIGIAVNLSPAQFKSRTLVLDVIAALGASGLNANRLELEITEAILLEETELTISILNELRGLGARISMDDFGTGYSSLGYLRKFPFDKIKIDRSFIQDITEKRDSIAIVRAVTGLSNSLGITTTAEGVETQEQLDQLRREGCTEVQGFHLSAPRPASELEPLLQRARASERAVA